MPLLKKVLVIWALVLMVGFSFGAYAADPNPISDPPDSPVSTPPDSDPVSTPPDSTPVSTPPATSGDNALVPKGCRGNAEIANGDCDLTAFDVLASNILRLVLGIAGALSLLMFVYGGFMYIIAGGLPSYASKGKSAMTYATIGLLIVILARVILMSVLNMLTGGGTP